MKITITNGYQRWAGVWQRSPGAAGFRTIAETWYGTHAGDEMAKDVIVPDNDTWIAASFGEGGPKIEGGNAELLEPLTQWLHP